MKHYLILLALCLLTSTLLAQQDFCGGWKKGYAAGMESLQKRTFITPICPIAPINGDTYEQGYAAGFKKATGRKTAPIPSPQTSKASFCEGWEKGYTVAMNAANKTAFITPICPVPPIHEDSYDNGYLQGYQKAQQKLGNSSTNQDWLPIQEGGSYCEGWERGYQFGLQLWAEQQNRRKPLKITPLCPIAPIRANTYRAAFERGKERALKDME